MGTHPKSPSRVASTNQILSDHLKANPSLIGPKVTNHFKVDDGNLPFLFKVLSIEKALSIQTHPDKKTAEELHAKQPDIYKGVSVCFPLQNRAHVYAHKQTRTISPKWHSPLLPSAPYADSVRSQKSQPTLKQHQN